MAEIEYPGVAQLVGRDIWDVEVGCSSHLTRTKKPSRSYISEGFFFVLYDAASEMPHSVFPHVYSSLFLIYNTNTDFI